MKTYIISHDGYMSEGCDIYKTQAEDLVDALGELFGTKEDIEQDMADAAEAEVTLTDKQYLEQCKNANGDGMPYYTIYCLEEDKKVFG